MPFRDVEKLFGINIDSGISLADENSAFFSETLGQLPVTASFYPYNCQAITSAEILYLITDLLQYPSCVLVQIFKQCLEAIIERQPMRDAYMAYYDLCPRAFTLNVFVRRHLRAAHVSFT